MHIIIIGCGRVGAVLASRLFQKGHEVAVIDSVAAAFQNLHPDFRGRTIEGEALHRDVLHRAGIEEADGLAAITNSDTLNAVIGHVARTVYQVPIVIARNYDPHMRNMHEVFGLQNVGSSSWGAQRIEELLSQSTLRTVFSAGNGEVEIYEFLVPHSWEGHNLQELLPQSECVAVAITRAGHSFLPDGETVIQTEDLVNVSATMEGIKALQSSLAELKEG